MGRATRLRLDATDGRLGLQADGEVLTLTATSVRVDLEPGALRVVAPRLSTGRAAANPVAG